MLVASFGLLSMASLSYTQQNPWEVPAEYQDMENPYANVEDDEKIGRILYSRNCKTCHGKKGKGDGTAAQLTDTPVADFTLASFKNQSDGSLYYKVYTGRNDMPGFEKIIPDEEDLWMVINYIKKF